MKNPWATFSFSYGLKAVISRRGSQTHKSLQHIADWTILLNQPFKVRKSSRLKVDNDLTFMCNFTLVAHSCIFVYWKDCSTLFHQTSPLPQSHSYLSASTLGITQLNCCTVYTYIHREIVCAYVYMALHTHTYIYSIFWLLFFFVSSRCDFLESWGWSGMGIPWYSLLYCCFMGQRKMRSNCGFL